jgi:lipoate-protein ligase B
MQEHTELLRKCNLIDLGLTEYGRCLEIQHELVRLRQEGRIFDTLILTEHEPVITFGRAYSDRAPELPYRVFYVERGGEGTYHAPGQMVAYPVLNLNENAIGPRTLVLSLLNSAAEALADVGITAEGLLNPVGLWVSGKKIGSVGLAVKQWVSYHGIAVNLNNDMKGFSVINPCGLHASVMTSASELLGHTVDMNRFKRKFVDAFMRRFRFSGEESDLDMLLMQKNKSST